MNQSRSSDETVPNDELILEAASRLFYHFGIQSVGVDKIADAAGVAKMTLYRYFPSKDDLIIAYLDRASKEFWKWFDEAAEARDDPAERLIAVFDALSEYCRSARCMGCAFQAAAAEFPNHDHPANERARAHKHRLRERLESMAAAAGYGDADDVANRLVLLIEGALASVRLLSLPVPAREARPAAEAILRNP